MMVIGTGGHKKDPLFTTLNADSTGMIVVNSGGKMSSIMNVLCLQLEEVHSATDQFFDLPITVKARYPYGERNHGWIMTEQER